MSQSPHRPSRILYIDLDALTPSHLSCYGYARRTSPTIDAIAREGLRCTNVYVSDAPCLPSRTAFYSGRFGIQNGVVGHGGTAAQPKVEGRLRGFRDRFVDHGFAYRLQQAGYHTAMISPFGQRHAAHQFYAGFNEIHNTGRMGMEPAELVQPVVDRWLDQHAADDGWYLHLNYWDIHTPYRAPASYGEPFADEPLPAWLDDDALIQRHVNKTGPHSAQDLGMYGDINAEYWTRLPERITDRASLTKWINGYDTAIRYVDDCIARIVDKLKAAGVYDTTAIIISADHGENQGELGIYGEHGTADHITCNVPMIVKWPGCASGRVDDALHYHLDWVPTVMDLVGGKKSELWSGRSYAATVTGAGDPPAPWDDLVISQCCHVCQRSVRFGRWLYIRTYHDGFHLFPREMLFDIDADPHELQDAAADEPDVCREGAWRLMRWHDEQMQIMADTASDVVDPLWTVIYEGGPFHAMHEPGRSPLPAYVERLEETGRADGARALREKYSIPDRPA
ncbi:MAG: sulfatase [Phycisphaeraceae bacterium]